jgi:hypothetical protein
MDRTVPASRCTRSAGWWQAADGWESAKSGVTASSVVGLEPWGKGGGAFVVGGEGRQGVRFRLPLTAASRQTNAVIGVGISSVFVPSRLDEAPWRVALIVVPIMCLRGHRRDLRCGPPSHCVADDPQEDHQIADISWGLMVRAR